MTLLLLGHVISYQQPRQMLRSRNDGQIQFTSGSKVKLQVTFFIVCFTIHWGGNNIT